MIDWPKEITGKDPFAQFCNRLLRAARQCEIVPSRTVKPRRSMKGTALDARTGGGGQSEPATLLTAYYQKSYANYWLCGPKGGGTPHIRIAKPPQIQNNIAGETIYSGTFTFNYSHNHAGDGLYGIYRISTSGTGVVEYQALIPQPQVGYQVKYISDDNTGLTVEAQDVADNPTDGVTVATPISFFDQTESSFAWSKLSDISYGH